MIGRSDKGIVLVGVVFDDLEIWPKSHAEWRWLPEYGGNVLDVRQQWELDTFSLKTGKTCPISVCSLIGPYMVHKCLDNTLVLCTCRFYLCPSHAGVCSSMLEKRFKYLQESSYSVDRIGP